MKKLYDHFVGTGQTERAKEILAIPEYSKFGEAADKPKKEK